MNTNINFEEFAGKHLVRSLVLLSYFALLGLGLNHSQFFVQSPIVKFSSIVIGFFASITAWVPAYFFAGVILGKFAFAHKVFYLYQQTDFAISITLVVLFIPITIMITKIINRTSLAFGVQQLVFFVTLMLLASSLAWTVDYLTVLTDQYVYIFTCSIVGLIYFLVL